jgi:hypothetical protein
MDPHPEHVTVHVSPGSLHEKDPVTGENCMVFGVTIELEGFASRHCCLFQDSLQHTSKSENVTVIHMGWFSSLSLQIPVAGTM